MMSPGRSYQKSQPHPSSYGNAKIEPDVKQSLADGATRDMLDAENSLEKNSGARNEDMFIIAWSVCAMSSEKIINN